MALVHTHTHARTHTHSQCLHWGLLTKQVSPLLGLAYLCNHGDAKPVFLPSRLRKVGDASWLFHAVSHVVLPGACQFLSRNDFPTLTRPILGYDVSTCDPYQLTYNEMTCSTGLRFETLGQIMTLFVTPYSLVGGHAGSVGRGTFAIQRQKWFAVVHLLDSALSVSTAVMSTWYHLLFSASEADVFWYRHLLVVPTCACGPALKPGLLGLRRLTITRKQPYSNSLRPSNTLRN